MYETVIVHHHFLAIKVFLHPPGRVEYCVLHTHRLSIALQHAGEEKMTFIITSCHLEDIWPGPGAG